MNHQSKEINEIATALAAAQLEFPELDRNRTVDVVKQGKKLYEFRYATLDHILAKCRPILAKNGIAITQQVNWGEASLSLQTRLLHSSGQWIASQVPVKASGDPQQLGSELTYKRRYSLAALIGVAAEEDDDANATKDQAAEPTGAHNAHRAGKPDKPGKSADDGAHNAHQSEEPEPEPARSPTPQPSTGFAHDASDRARPIHKAKLQERIDRLESPDEVIEWADKVKEYEPIRENPRTWPHLDAMLQMRLGVLKSTNAWPPESIDDASGHIGEIWVEVATEAVQSFTTPESLLAFAVELREKAPPKSADRWAKIRLAIGSAAVHGVTYAKWSSEVCDKIGDELEEHKKAIAEMVKASVANTTTNPESEAGDASSEESETEETREQTDSAD